MEVIEPSQRTMPQINIKFHLSHIVHHMSYMANDGHSSFVRVNKSVITSHILSEAYHMSNIIYILFLAKCQVSGYFQQLKYPQMLHTGWKPMSKSAN